MMELTAALVKDAIRTANRWPKNRGRKYFSINRLGSWTATNEERRKYG